jgi:uncharacterized protein YcbX
VTGHVTDIWRHPIKSHGREALQRVALTAGTTLPWDRTWAVAHERAKIQDGEWGVCGNFQRGSKSPALMAIEARLDQTSGQLTLTHPDCPVLTFDPETDAAAFLDWVAPLRNPEQPAPRRLTRPSTRGMTDSPYPSISILNHASRRALSDKAGRDVSARRFRGNIWLDGLGPWEEFEWIGKIVRIGSAELRVEERIVRCAATSANPDTGKRDMDTPGTIDTGWGHQDFGVYAVVVSDGDVRVGDSAELVR